MKKYKVYDYCDIANFANVNGYYITELGEENIGTNFLSLKSYDEDKVISFILNSASCSTYFYECIYSDYE